MKFLLPLLVLLPGPALAHFGHLGGAAGHDHWIAGAAVGAAVAVGVWGWWQGKKARPEPEPEAEAEAEPDDAAQEA